MFAIYLKLFISFFQIGLFGFGGGYAMISMIQGEVVNRYHWLSMGQFTDIVAISQSTPGPIGINAATYVGFTSLTNEGYGWLAGVMGSAIATFAVVLPSFVLMVLISRFFLRYKDHPAVADVFAGLRPAVIGLLAAAALLLLTPDNFSTPAHAWQFVLSILIFVFAFIACTVYRINPIRIIIFCGVAGIILF